MDSKNNKSIDGLTLLVGFFGIILGIASYFGLADELIAWIAS